MAEIQELSIKVSAVGVDKTTQDISKLTKSLKNLSKKLPEISNALNNVNYEGLTKATKALKDISKIDLSNLSLLSSLKSVMATQNLNKIKESATEVATTLSGTEATSDFSGIKSQANSLFGVLMQLKLAFVGLSESMKGKLSTNFEKFKTSVSGFLKSVGRIAMYRLIRSGIKMITDAFSEGINNAYQWSKKVDGSFSKSMDTIKTSTTYLKNSIGAAIIPLLNALAPIIDSLVDKIVNGINLINQAIATLTGASTWTKATKQATEYADAVDGASNAAKSLAGFDELNNIGSSSSSGSGSSTDYSGMFEEVTNELKNNSLLKSLGMAIDDIFFEWGDNLNSENIAEKLLTFVFGAIGFYLGGSVGAIAGVGLGVYLSSVFFDHDGKLSLDEIVLPLSAITLTIAGIASGNPYVKIAASLILLFTSLFVEWNGDVDISAINKEAEALGISYHDALVLGFTGDEEHDKEIILEKYGELGAVACDGLYSDENQSRFEKATTNWWESFKDMVNYAFVDLGIEDSYKGYGEDCSDGLTEGLESGTNSNQSRTQNIFSKIGTWFKNLFGIHSPSTVFQGYGVNMLQGLINGIGNKQPTVLSTLTKLWSKVSSNAGSGMGSLWSTLQQKWDEIKNWWSGLSLGSFKIKMPHISVTTTGKWGIPSFSVDWYDKGTNYVAQDQLAMIHKGEAIVPAKYNQNPAYQPTNSNMETILVEILNAINDKDMNTYIDGNEIGKASVKYINKQSRLKGASIL